MKNVPWLSEKRAADGKCTLVICKARSAQLMKNIYLGYLRSEQYTADEKCTLILSAQLVILGPKNA